MQYVESLKVFTRVIELGSITSGGRDMRITPAVASKRLKELEARLGVRLLNRTTRSLAPTEAGKVLYEHALKLLEGLEEAEAAVANFSETPQGVIRMTAPLGAGRKVIAPLVPHFSREFPGIDVRMRLSDRKVDLFNEGLDLAFFIGTPGDSSLKLRKIADCRRVICASPDYVAEHGRPLKPEDLLSPDHNCLLLRYPRSPEYYWSLQTPQGTRRLAVSGRFDADDGEVLTQWAIDGHGIANKPRFEVEPQLRSGELVELLPETPPVPIVFGCLFPHRKLQDPKIRSFMEFVVAGCAAQFS